MRQPLFAAYVVLAACCSLRAQSPALAPKHDRAFWKALIAKADAPPPADAAALARELYTMLGSPDSELRDEIPGAVLEHWLFETSCLTADDRRAFVRGLEANLRRDIGSKDTDAVLLRSFSALHLAYYAALDLREPFLDETAWRELLDRALEYLAKEEDVRGFVVGKGWHHSAAHTADLLKFLARSPRMTLADQARVFAAIEEKLVHAPQVFVFGEDERLAAALQSIVARDDVDLDAFRAFTDRCARHRADVWKIEPFEVARFVAGQNVTNALRALCVRLDTITAPKETVGQARGLVVGVFAGR